MKLYKFYTEGCSQCKVLDTMLKDFSTLPIEHIDCDEDTNDLVSKYKVRSIPTLVLVDEAKNMLDKLVGIVTKENLEETINKYRK